MTQKRALEILGSNFFGIKEAENIGFEISEEDLKKLENVQFSEEELKRGLEKDYFLFPMFSTPGNKTTCEWVFTSKP